MPRRRRWALAALAVPLKLWWLGAAGLVVAAAGAVASLVISTEQGPAGEQA